MMVVCPRVTISKLPTFLAPLSVNQLKWPTRWYQINFTQRLPHMKQNGGADLGNK